ncbi:MAG: hypothetical protein A3A80_03580 [Candidatus Terrybacteria bacterium RIFCSPLOWO2_01_FULL_44_24]|uniref:Potassium channel domain-containing protein n=1 Tax=Candidatus Terrybacteria bacterium RIFCSPHIGHO2_01_FULL_43_35 TaxID=1802361 RepID=A0A1G2PFN8_9BACT|nr:MAG: hypothetical protein A2828_00500 [Candidatus Terrybacteria bacterium RIFCSPHIGHO2_01_FULL_43_35]OHA49763.1 MAG: hypothetical protein A3B75_02075 [Candidatus Terrybacteria bacterium RIFCSPHIGHO2_02_FULL_43_14]OHA51585.1 MAG: hypothetical protein A3A80_03580 [Candidatus Terrybacteria bacterium RIFCSPLOWO2_01_FULL_44_24]
MRKGVAIALGNLIFVSGTGTIAYHFLEGWSWVDSFYFVGMHITTVGTAALEPTRDITKILAVFIDFAGIILGFYSLTIMAIFYFKNSDLGLWRMLSFGSSEKKKDQKTQ